MPSLHYYALSVVLLVPAFFCVGFCHEESHWQPVYDYYHIDLGDLGGHHGGLEIKTPSPRDVMVDVINELGVKLLAIHNEHNENNIGISPYGALSVLAALTEGIQGDAASEIVYAAHIPKDKHIVRVGLRDIHRHLKSYFIPPEGFLAGLTLNLNNVTLRSEYEDVLRFYGFDYGSFNNALYPGPSTTPTPSADNTTSLGTTLGVSERVTEFSITKTVDETTTVKAVNRLGSPTHTTPNEEPITTTVATTTENLSRTPPETTLKLTEASSELTTKPSEKTTTKSSLDVTMTTTSAPITLTATEGTTKSTITTIGDSAPQETTIVTTMQNILPASTTTTSAITTTTEANTVTTTGLPGTTNTGTETVTVQKEDTTVMETTSEISTSTVKTSSPTEKVEKATEMRDSTVISTTSLPTTTTKTTVTDILTTTTQPPSTTTLLTTTTVPMTTKEGIMSTLESVTSTKETTAIPQVTTQISTDILTEMQTPLPSTEVTNEETITTVTIPTTEEVKTVITETSTMTTTSEINPETTPPQELLQQLQDLQTTTPFFIGTTPEFQDMGDFDQNNFDFNYNYDANAQFNNGTDAQETPLYDDANAALPDTNNFPNTSEGFNRNFRRVRSVADYVFARYYEHSSHYIPPHKRPYRPYYRPEEPLTFAAYGKYQEPGVNFMKYDTVLPFYFIPNLNALALSFPLDNTKYYLLLLLPVDFNGVDQLICDLRLHGNLRFILENLRLTHVIATIPSFTLKGYVTLTPTLQQLGIRRIFEPRQADFSPMTNVTDIYVTNIEQAVTVTIRNYLDASAENYKNLRRYPPVQFRADHPFLYFVMDTELNVALMVGKVVNPLNSRIR